MLKRLKYLLKWIPIIWNDRDWDFTYLYSIIRHKLNVTSTDDRYNKIAIRLIDKIQNSYYELEYTDYIKYVMVPTSDNPRLYELRVVYDRLDEYFSRYPRKYINTNNREYDAIVLSSNNKRRAIRLLYAILERKMEY